MAFKNRRLYNIYIYNFVPRHFVITNSTHVREPYIHTQHYQKKKKKKPGMSEVVGNGLKTFDAFPKVASSYSIKSTRGGFVTVLLGVSCLFLIWLQLAEYIGGVEEHQFWVDREIARELQINVDITVNMPCDALTINVQDASLDRLFAHEILTFDPAILDFSGSHLVEENQPYDSLHRVIKKAKKSKFKGRKDRKKQKKNEAGSACRIYGQLPVTRVQGDLHITAKGYGYMDRRVLSPDQLNFTHVIDEFSFGEYYPKLVNPLDETHSIATNNFQSFQYFLSVVRTHYKSSSTGYRVDTNQYAVTEQKRTPETSGGQPPGLFFKYDFEPLALTITDTRMPFTQWLVRLVNVIGGMVVTTGWLYKLSEGPLTRFLGKTKLRTGMLDSYSKPGTE